MPLVSVVLPIRNEATCIERSLGAILAQDYPADRLEVVVADGGSADGTLEIVQRLVAGNAHVRLVDNPGRIVPTGLNAALAVAEGVIIVRVDGHTEIAPDYIRQCVTALARTQADNVGGKMTARSVTPLGAAVALATSSPFGIGGARFHYSDAEEWVDTVYLGAWRREVFNKIGLFDEELVRDQDDEFNCRLRERGGRILLSPKIRSTYTGRRTLRSLWRQYFQYGYWKVRVMQKHPRQMRPRQFVPPAFVAALIGMAPLGLFAPAAGYLFAAVVGTYLAANLLASIWTVRRCGLRHLPLLPVAFATLHLSYGLGFLVGLVKFWNRWGDKVGNTPRLPASRAADG